MTKVLKMAARHLCVAGMALLAGAGSFGPARAADLAREPRRLESRRPLHYSYLPGENTDPGPASSSGYYGYYGYDVLGVPYDGLYSANVLCLRSLPSPTGYHTVNVCQR